MKCPRCNKSDCIDDVVFRNAENYHAGTTKTYYVACKKCGKSVRVAIATHARVHSIDKSNKTRAELDW